MKSIANQYRDLQEGRMSQFNFMRNLRMSMPQVTNTTSFGDAVKILKNKGIIAESYKGNDEWLKAFKSILVNRYDINHIGMGDEEMISKYGNMEPEAAAKNFLEDPEADYDFIGSIGENFDEAQVISKEEFEQPEEETNDEDAEFDAILKQLEDEMAGERAVKSDVLDEPLEEEKEELNENQEVKATDENFEEVTTGIEVEHECYPDWSYEEVLKCVRKNIKKNPNYYTNYKLTGIRDYEMETMDSSKPEDHQMKFVKDSNLNDKAREMKKVKMPKKEEKKKLKENKDTPHSIKADQGIDKSELNFLKKAYADRPTDKIPEKFKKIMQDLEDRIAAREKNEAMAFKDLPADPEKYKIVRDSKGYIIKATNSDGVEFQKGDVVKTYDGEEIKIEKFEESQGKVKAIYNAGMFYRGIDIDGLEAPKATFRPGVNMGGSFEKFKSKLAEMVREAIAEMYDGRDNIDAEVETNEDYNNIPSGNAQIKLTNTTGGNSRNIEGTPEIPDVSKYDIPTLNLKKDNKMVGSIFYNKKANKFLDATDQLEVIATPLNDVAKEWFEKLKQATK